MKTGGILLLRLEEANCVKLGAFYESEKWKFMKYYTRKNGGNMIYLLVILNSIILIKIGFLSDVCDI